MCAFFKYEAFVFTCDTNVFLAAPVMSRLANASQTKRCLNKDAFFASQLSHSLFPDIRNHLCIDQMNIMITEQRRTHPLDVQTPGVLMYSTFQTLHLIKWPLKDLARWTGLQHIREWKEKRGLLYGTGGTDGELLNIHRNPPDLVRLS